MFQFRTKTKPLPKNMVQRKKTGFAKKPVSRRGVVAPASENGVIETVSDDWRRAYVVLWTIFLFVTVYVLIFSPFLRLDVIRVDGASAVSEQDIERFIRSSMSEKYFGFIPHDNLLVFPREKVEMGMLERFNSIRSAELSRTFPDTLTVRIQERKAIALWCAGATCFHVDEYGYAYAAVDPSQEDLRSENLLRITDTGAQTIDTSEPLLDSGFAVFASAVRDRLKQELDIETDSECSTPSRLSEQLTIKTQEGWFLHVDARLSLDESLRTLRLLLQKEISQERRQHLKYVDLRTAQRVYYSVEGETVSAPEQVDEEVASPQASVPAADSNPVSKDKKK